VVLWALGFGVVLPGICLVLSFSLPTRRYGLLYTALLVQCLRPYIKKREGAPRPPPPRIGNCRAARRGGHKPQAFSFCAWHLGIGCPRPVYHRGGRSSGCGVYLAFGQLLYYFTSPEDHWDGLPAGATMGLEKSASTAIRCTDG
jgi:hypothetical protein